MMEFLVRGRAASALGVSVLILAVAGCDQSPAVNNHSGSGGAGGSAGPVIAANASDDTLSLFRGGRGAPLMISSLLANDGAVGDPEIIAVDFPAATTGGGRVLLDEQGAAPLVDQIIRYTPPATGALDSFSYTVTNSTGGTASATVTIALSEPAACDAQIALRKASGLGWCYETYFDSFDSGADTDGSGTNIALQVFVPHPWHQRQNAIASGASLGATEAGYSPLLIHSHGFGGSKQEDFQNPETFLDNQVAKAAWEDGYNVISYTQRGFGGSPESGSVDNEVSGDSLRILDPDFEGFDFIRVVDWAICHLRNDAPLENASAAEQHQVEANNCSDFNGAGNWGSSMLATDSGARLTDFDDDVALATVGYSYGGGYQFLAQSVDARVDAIMPMGTWHDLRYSLHPNDTPKYTWTTIMTAFSSTAPGLGGGNGEALPPVLTDGNVEMSPAPRPAGGNNEAVDNPHNKDRQVSVKHARILSPKGPVAWCNGAQAYYADKYGDADGDPEDLAAGDPGPAGGANEFDLPPKPENTPAHFVLSERAPRANLFMIQGYADTLFNYNEGYLNAKCFEDAGVADVRLLQQTSGHPFPNPGDIPIPGVGAALAGLIPPHYAGQDTAMYLDEIVHCGVNDSGNPVRYNMVEVLKQWTDFHLRDGLLPDGMSSAEDIFPTACITQTNVDPNLTLEESDPFYSGTNSATTGFKWSREGVVFDRIADTPVGHSHYLVPDMTQLNGDGNFDIPATTVTSTTAVTDLLAPASNVPLYTASDPNGEILAGIPLVHLQLSKPLLGLVTDPVAYVGVYVKRCQDNPADTGFDGGGAPICDAGTTPELLHFQMTSIRVFEAGLTPPNDAIYPRIDPRNFPGDGVNGTYYPYVSGDNPTTMRSGTDIVNNSSLTDPQGTIIGVSARLYPGDEVGLSFAAASPIFLTVGSLPGAAGQLTISGTAQLPLVTTAERRDAPTNVPAYVNNAAP